MRASQISVFGLLLAILCMPHGGHAAVVKDCAGALSSESAPLESLASVAEYTQEQTLAAAWAVRATFKTSDSEQIDSLNERLAVAEQNFLHRGRENNLQAVRALEQFAKDEIPRTHPSLTKLQKVIDESVEWSRSSGILRRLELDEHAWLAGDPYNLFDIYGPRPRPFLRRLTERVKNRLSSPTLQFVRAESYARDLLRLPDWQRLSLLKKALRAASPALGWNEVVTVLGAFDLGQREAALEIMRPQIFASIEFFTDEVRNSLRVLVPGIFEPEKVLKSKMNRLIVGLSAAMVLSVGGLQIYDHVSVGMRTLSDGTTVSEKKERLLAFKAYSTRAEAFSNTVSVKNLQEMTVPEAVELANAFKPTSGWDQVGPKLHDEVLTRYSALHPELKGKALQRLADAAITDEAHDAILQPKAGTK